MKKQTTNLTDHMVGFEQAKTNYTQYETSFRRWLVQEIESGRMSWQEARSRFNLPYHFDKNYKEWQKKYSEEIIVSLSLMSATERSDNKELEKRIKQLEKELELAQMKAVALNTMIDIAEKDYKLEIRKKSGPKQ